MDIKEAVLWALLGGGTAELTLIWGVMKPTAGRKIWSFPWSKGEFPAYVVGLTIRLFITGAFAAPLAATGKMTDGMMAFVVGVAAPLLMARLAATARALVEPAVQEALSPADGTQADPPASYAGNGEIPGPRAEDASGTDVAQTGEENAAQ
ncbi:hypothetical protein [Streptomyces sp. enrichment culture]|uniref:hypothetical protein n=1 Tax=Streptomyces sp. enrichment culture TaxID=1795815 RepID=UPI003F577753